MQHTPRVVDDFVDVDTHCVRMCVCMCLLQRMNWCIGRDAFCSRVRCVSVVESERDKVQHYNTIM